MFTYVRRTIYLITICLSIQTPTIADDTVLSLKKDRVVDFLFITDRKDVNHLKPDYFKDIYPPAQKIGFERSPFFLINQQPISGEYFPYVLAIGSWPGNWENRQQLFKELVDARPDIRKRRLAIWSTFNMLNYEVKEDYDIHFDNTKTYVMSVYWQKDESVFASFKDTIVNKIKDSGGQVKLRFEEGHTMFGYTQPASLMMITEWDNQSSFEAFYQQINNAQDNATKYTSNYYLSLPPK